MPEKLLHGVWTRQKWQQERDAQKVPKGAAKVSMGDALDKFHKAADKGIKTGVPAADALRKAIATYKSAIKAKHKAFHDRIERQLEHYVNAYVTDAGKLTTAVGQYASRREAAATQLRQVGAEFLHWEKAGGRGMGFKPTNEKAAVKAMTEFVDVVKKMPYYSDAIKADDAKAYDKAVYAASGGAWSKTGVEKLVELVKKFPASP